MANKLYDEASVQAIANAIRSKNKTETKYKISQMAQAIEDIPAVIKRKTGNPIEITDAAAAPIVKCVTEIQGYQEGSGTPSPDNIRPIVAYTEGEIEVRGKNAIDNSSVVTGYIGADGELVVNGSYKTTPYIRVFGNNTYTLSVNVILLGAVGITLNWYDANQEFISKDSNNSTSLGIIYLTAQAPSNARFVRCSFGATTYTTDWQLEMGSATPYEPYTSTTHTTTFPSAIYRGSEDVVKRSVMATWGIYTITGSESWTKWGDAPVYYATIGISSVDNYDQVNCVAERLEGVTISEIYTGQKSSGIAVRSSLAYISETDYARRSDFIGMKIAFKRATPTTSPVTVSNLPIRTLSGYNHIESSTGEMVVDYITDAYQNFVDTVESALPNTRKGGAKAMDVFLSLDTLEETTSSENIETKENNNSEDNNSEDISENIEETR